MVRDRGRCASAGLDKIPWGGMVRLGPRRLAVARERLLHMTTTSPRHDERRPPHGRTRSIVMPMPRVTRWTGLLFLPLLVGALLLMHGLDARAGESHPSATSAVAGAVEEHPHAAATSDEHGHRGVHCADCTARHLMVACVAILTAVGGVGLVRRLVRRAHLAGSLVAVIDRSRALVELARPPDPPWVRLSVMRC